MSTLARSSSSFSGWCRQRDGLGVCVVECIGYGISKQIFTRYDTHTQTINRSSLTPADGETSFFDWKISKKEAIEFLRVGRFWYHILLFFFKCSSTIMSLSFFFSSSSLIFFHVEEFLSSNSERVKEIRSQRRHLRRCFLSTRHVFGFVVVRPSGSECASSSSSWGCDVYKIRQRVKKRKSSFYFEENFLFFFTSACIFGLGGFLSHSSAHHTQHDALQLGSSFQLIEEKQ